MLIALLSACGPNLIRVEPSVVEQTFEFGYWAECRNGDPIHGGVAADFTVVNLTDEEVLVAPIDPLPTVEDGWAPTETGVWGASADMTFAVEPNGEHLAYVHVRFVCAGSAPEKGKYDLEGLFEATSGDVTEAFAVPIRFLLE